MRQAPFVDRKAALVALLLAGTLGSGSAMAQEGSAEHLRARIDEAREAVYPALVNISAVIRYFDSGRTQRSPGAGSGVVVDEAGHVLTNFHVAGNTTLLSCTLPSGERLDATVLAHDPLTDLSVLALDLSDRPADAPPLAHASLGDSDALEVGDYVLAMGNPLNLSSSMTLGIVSNPRRVFTDFLGSEIVDLDLGEGEMTGLFTRWIQHDALILPGNSGGPLVNLAGEVVGINELGFGGVGFAIPSTLAADVLAQALAHGEVRRGWLGMALLPVDKLGRSEGALVASVVPGSPAEAGGLQAGDLLLAIDGQTVQCRFFEEVPVVHQLVAQLPVGGKAVLRYERDGKVKEASVDVELMEKSLGDEVEIREVGATVRDITRTMARARQLPTTDGVLVTGVRPGMPFDAARPPLQMEDVVVAVGGQPVHDVEGLQQRVRKLGYGKAAVEFRRGEESFVTVMERKEDGRHRGGGELPKAWLGLQTQVLTQPIADSLGLAGSTGHRITRVYPWTKAHEAGLRPGDVITAVDGVAMEASRPQDAHDLRRMVETLVIGESAELTLLRDGKPASVEVEMEQTPESAHEQAQAESKELEFKVRDLSFLDRVDRKWEKDQQGVLVVDVVNGGWAHVGGLHLNDLILSIDGRPVGDVKAFENVMKVVIETEPEVVKVFVRRGPGTHFVFIEPDWTAFGEE